jgi:hypothetical protein
MYLKRSKRQALNLRSGRQLLGLVLIPRTPCPCGTSRRLADVPETRRNYGSRSSEPYFQMPPAGSIVLLEGLSNDVCRVFRSLPLYLQTRKQGLSKSGPAIWMPATLSSLSKFLSNSVCRGFTGLPMKKRERSNEPQYFRMLHASSSIKLLFSSVCQSPRNLTVPERRKVTLEELSLADVSSLPLMSKAN